jgi:hypothetical protein
MELWKPTLKECSELTTKYLITHGGTSEFNKLINDVSRETIKAMKRECGTCYLGKINLYDNDRKKPYKLVKYTGQKIYNFEYCFCLPCYDEEVERMIEERDKAPYTGTAEDSRRVEAITERVQQIGGKHLFWS